MPSTGRLFESRLNWRNWEKELVMIKGTSQKPRQWFISENTIWKLWSPNWLLERMRHPKGKLCPVYSWDRSWGISEHRPANPPGRPGQDRSRQDLPALGWRRDYFFLITSPSNLFPHLQVWSLVIKQEQGWRERISLFSFCLNTIKGIWRENGSIPLNPPREANFGKVTAQNSVLDQRALYFHFEVVIKAWNILDRIDMQNSRK